MSNQFRIFAVPDDAAQAEEAMGSGFKFWFNHQELGIAADSLIRAKLFRLTKQSRSQIRPNFGDDSYNSS